MDRHIVSEDRRRIIRSATATIPEDMLIWDVLVRLPVKYIARFKSVCRSWRSALEDPAFVRRHLDTSRAMPTSVLIIPDQKQPDDESTSTGISFHRIAPLASPPATQAELMHVAHPLPRINHSNFARAHCDGMVMLTGAPPARQTIFVCNPATKELVQLPPGSGVADDDGHTRAALGFDAWRNRYVVARFFHGKYPEYYDDAGVPRVQHDVGHEVFALGGGSWERTADPPRRICPDVSPVCTRQAVYWAAYLSNESTALPDGLLRFGLRDGAFDVVPCPPGVAAIGDRDEVTELAGGARRRAVLRPPGHGDGLRVWLADDGPGPQWSRRYRIDFSREADEVGFAMPMVASGNKMLICVDHEILCSYDMGSEDVKELVDMQRKLEYRRHDGSKFTCDARPTEHYVTPYVESLISITMRNY